MCSAATLLRPFKLLKIKFGVSMHAYSTHYTQRMAVRLFVCSHLNVSINIHTVSWTHLAMPLFLTIENKIMYHNTWHSNGDIYHMYTRCDELCATAKVVAFYCGIVSMQPTYSKYGLSFHSVSFHFHFASLFRLHRKTEVDGKKPAEKRKHIENRWRRWRQRKQCAWCRCMAYSVCACV